jgi:peptidylprolyl isomerase
VRDVVVGSGADVVVGSRVQTHYAACTSSGLTFAEVAAPGIFTFTVGRGQVIAGLDEGVQGMKLGGRRQLIIPPELGYGQGGSPGGFVVPNDTLVMTIDAVGLR